MVRRTRTVIELAAEADLDLDDTLIALWDIGIESVNGRADSVPDRHIKAAREALGLNNPRDSFSVDYWIHRAELDRTEIAAKLLEFGIELSPTARKIPKNSLRILKNLFDHPATIPQEISTTPPPQQPNIPLHEWRIVGKERQEIYYLEQKDIISIHKALETHFSETSDPISPPGVKNLALTSMSAQRPRTALGEMLKYPTLEMAGAALFLSIIQNHGFHNGNKRTALVSLVAFLYKNRLMLTCSKRDLYRKTIRAAKHGLVKYDVTNTVDLADREVMHMSEWILENSVTYRKEDHPLRWHELSRILKTYKCDIANSKSGGNKITILREESRDSWPGKIKPKKLKTHVVVAGDSTEVDKGTVRKIRSDLRLSDIHGYDSVTFYNADNPNEIIREYLPVLEQLSRL